MTNSERIESIKISVEDKCDIDYQDTRFLLSQLETKERELETERIRLAACGTAALGYFTGCAEEYKSASLGDVLRLYEGYTHITELNKVCVDALEKIYESDCIDCVSDAVAKQALDQVKKSQEGK